MVRVYIEPEFGTEYEKVRTHPWTTGEADEAHRYVNFKAEPHLIPEVLEDFKPFANYDSIQTFYEMLAWLNGPGSVFESNDCALGRIAPTPAADAVNFPARLRIKGRLMLLFRNLPINVYHGSIQSLVQTVARTLHGIDAQFVLGCVGVTYMETHYLELKESGYELVLEFFAWGDTEGDVMANLGRVFVNIFEALRTVSDGFRSVGL